MPDVEKVIKGLKYLHDVKRWSPNESEESITARRNITGDALALLKAQEPVKPKIIDTANSKLYNNDMFKNHYCGNCGEFLHVVNRKDLFCSQCGKAVKWND